ncbi:RNA-directed DNA polymerase, eukaryota [Tanacetum coccineum]
MLSESNDEPPIEIFEILQTKLNNMDEQAFDNELGTEGDKKDGENRYSIDSPKKKMEEDTNFNSTNSETKDNSSDLSRPPGFEFMKKSFSSSSNCSTSFARRRKNDIKGFSLLSELNQIIDVAHHLVIDNDVFITTDWECKDMDNNIRVLQARLLFLQGTIGSIILIKTKIVLVIDRINNGQWSWNWSRTNLGVRNLAYLCDMLNEIGQLNIDVNEDTCTWSLGPNGTFTVKDARYRIDQNILPTLAHTTTWDKSIPRKVNVFMWRLSLDRLPHRLNLSSRGMDIPAISCPSCNANVESANHVFFECDIATDMWKLVFRWCDIPLFQASSWDSFNDWIISWHASKEKKHRFYVITTSVLWWLWRYRNSVTFSSQPLRKSDLFDNVRFSSFSWLHNRDHMKLSWNDWLMYPLSITRNGNG